MAIVNGTEMPVVVDILKQEFDKEKYPDGFIFKGDEQYKAIKQHDKSVSISDYPKMLKMLKKLTKTTADIVLHPFYSTSALEE